MISIPFNMKITWSSELREQPEDLDQMRSGVEFLKERLAQAKSSLERAQVLGWLGAYLRIIGELEASKKNFLEAITLAQAAGEQKLVTTLQVRLSTTLHWLEEYEECGALLADLRKQLENDPARIDYVHQHYGKLLIELGKFDEARSELENALQLRRKKGEPELIQSTLQALDLLDRMKIRSGGSA
jgi:tetratricopeptide (TPR) repeat protein